VSIPFSQGRSKDIRKQKQHAASSDSLMQESSDGAILKSPQVSAVTAHAVEFVAKPSEAHKVQSALPLAITNALGVIHGFSGCMVMVSDQEARLVTVVTFWMGHDRVKICGDNERWVNALLAPYLDRRLRAQRLAAQLPMLPRISETSRSIANDELLSHSEMSRTVDMAEAEAICVT
jgi:hypothetical protein